MTLSGRAYPGRAVTLLKDAAVVSSAAAGSDGSFSLSVSGLSSGNYIFSLYSEDKNGNRSSLHTFPVSITAGATTNVSGIFIAPTIAVDKEEVKRGDTITIFGQSAPAADILITVGSEEEIVVKTKADTGGAYLYYFDTSELDYGSHSAKSKATLLNQLLSSYSRAAGFTVGTKNVLAKTGEASAKGDINADRRVNLVDFSVMAYWYRRVAPPTHVDLNTDRKIDLIDFSILAYYWTG